MALLYSTQADEFRAQKNRMSIPETDYNVATATTGPNRFLSEEENLDAQIAKLLYERRKRDQALN